MAWLIAALAACPAAATDLAAPARVGVVTRAVDGDTVWWRPQGGGAVLKIRIEGIDAPEICQSGGQAARRALKSLVAARDVSITSNAVDDYGRTLARLSVQGEDVGQQMVGQGNAWSYRYRSSPGPYPGEERAAREKRLGVFADPQAENPRDFRRRHGSCY